MLTIVYCDPFPAPSPETAGAYCSGLSARRFVLTAPFRNVPLQTRLQDVDFWNLSPRKGRARSAAHLSRPSLGYVSARPTLRRPKTRLAPAGRCLPSQMHPSRDTSRVAVLRDSSCRLGHSLSSMQAKRQGAQRPPSSVVPYFCLGRATSRCASRATCAPRGGRQERVAAGPPPLS